MFKKLKLFVRQLIFSKIVFRPFNFYTKPIPPFRSAEYFDSLNIFFVIEILRFAKYYVITGFY